MIKYITVFILLIVIISSCSDDIENKGNVIIEDVGLPLLDSVTVQLNEGDHISKAIVRLVGDVDGAYIINEYKYEKGPIDSIIYSHDWYQPIYKIEYQPIEAKNGYLMVIVEFL